MKCSVQDFLRLLKKGRLNINPNMTTMARQIEMDADMRELVTILGACIRKNHRPVYRENLHSPYYSRSRYKRVA